MVHATGFSRFWLVTEWEGRKKKKGSDKKTTYPLRSECILRSARGIYEEPLGKNRRYGIIMARSRVGGTMWWEGTAQQQQLNQYGL